MMLLEIGVDPIRGKDVMIWILTGIVTLVLYMFRNNLIIGPIWRAYKLFWMVLFVMLLGSYAKKQIKAWWNKD